MMAAPTTITTTLRTPSSKLTRRGHTNTNTNKPINAADGDREVVKEKKMMSITSGGGVLRKASFMSWSMKDVVHVARYHRIPCVFAVGLLFFMAVEYTLRMIPAYSQPFDLGFVATKSFHNLLATWPELNTLLAALNTGFLGSGVDFPVGNVSFFLFFSGHVAGSVIASLDMRRMQRRELAWIFDILNVLQVIRLLGTRGHYTIDLAVGVGAGILFDSLAGKYEDAKRKSLIATKEASLKLNKTNVNNTREL
ncbi:hypothetical protein Pint_30136 [Pistacia integerrima]|uniref:Uncharacterized protein n=1 Tax=Pistacia integerrima TaxID=434235 RepID=A0ACC0X0F5_9ROSI|nr:hypothetical protein Pint_30136 [Pistacia integerrima]